MLTAFLLGVIAQTSLLLSGLAAYVIKAPIQIVGGLAAFGAGALIAAVALNLVPEANHMTRFWPKRVKEKIIPANPSATFETRGDTAAAPARS